MALQSVVSRTVAATLLAFTALVSVGLTAPADGVFSITIRPVVMQLAIEFDVHLGPMHFHTRWAAIDE